mmetsp:Transcript_4014/g.8045  ORF Transcript_4014/g.8045 Transcript_4014/m.8045 type:complete len:529 (+) Transcript_4014:120-1706(+)
MEWSNFLQELRSRFPSPLAFGPLAHVPRREDFPLEDALFIVTENDYLSALEFIVDFFQVNLESTTCREYRSILHLACTMGSLGATCFCLDKGIPLEIRDNEGRTPLMSALFSGEEGFLCAQVLLEAGANPNVRTTADWTLLHCVVFHGSCSPGALGALLERGAVPNARDPNGRTPLHTAMLSARGNTLETVRILLANGADINAQSQTGWTPLALCRDEAIALQLLQAGARPDIPNRRGETILHFACQRWKAASDVVFQAVVDLLYNPTNVHLTDTEGRTPLHWVCQQASEKTIRYVEPLMLRGANPDARDNAGRTPLHYAALIPAISFGKATLLSFERRRDTETDPVEADIQQTVRLIERLVALGADVSFQDMDGQSALHYASLTGSIEIVRCLLEHGSPVGQRDLLGRTPLHLFGFRIGPLNMVLWRGAATASFLHEHGHDEARLRQTRDPQYEEAIFPYCAIEGELFEASRREEVVQTLHILLQAGAPVYVMDNAGNFPFFVAAAARWFDPVYMLIREAAAQGLFQ